MAGPANLRINIVASARQVGKELDKTAGKFKKFGKGLKVAGAGIGAAIGAGFAIIVDSVKKAADEEESIKRLETAIKNAGGAFKGSTDDVVAWIDEIKRSSTFTDDELRPALADLVNATGDVTAAQGLLRTAMDLSVASGQPLDAVTRAVGKATNNQTGALKKLFPELNTQENKNKTGAELLQILADKYKGSDRAATDTVKGGFKLFQETLDDIQETLGEQFLPYLQDFTDWAKSPDGKKTIEDVTKLVGFLGDAFIKAAGGIDEVIIGFRSYAAFYKSKEFQDALTVLQFLGGPEVFLAVRELKKRLPKNPRPYFDLLDEIVNGPAPSGNARNQRQVPRRNGPAVGTTSLDRPTTIINISTLDPAAAGVAVRRALNTDATRRGNLVIGG